MTESLGIFNELVRPRESVFRFAEVSTILTLDPKMTLAELFERFVHRQFAQTTEYQEVVMARRLGDVLQAHNLMRHFRKNARVGNDLFHTNLTFVSEAQNQAGVPLQAIKALDLDRDEPTKIYDHGDAWIQRIKRLRNLGACPESMLFMVRFPETEVNRMKAAETIRTELEAQEVNVLQDTQENEVVQFASGVLVR